MRTFSPKPTGGCAAIAALPGWTERTSPISSRMARRIGTLSNGEEVWFLDRETSAHALKIAGFYSQDNLERRIAVRATRPDLPCKAIKAWSYSDSSRREGRTLPSG